MFVKKVILFCDKNTYIYFVNQRFRYKIVIWLFHENKTLTVHFLYSQYRDTSSIRKSILNYVEEVRY